VAREVAICERYHQNRNKMDRKLQKLQKLQQSTGVKMDLQQNNNKTTAEDNKNDTTYLTKPINNYHIETSNENHKKNDRNQ
jgi:hypothetical protein